MILVGWVGWIVVWLLAPGGAGGCWGWGWLVRAQVRGMGAGPGGKGLFCNGGWMGRSRGGPTGGDGPPVWVS